MSRGEASNQLHLDAAQTEVDRDEFGFKALADNVANSIISLLTAPSSGGSFVIALEGKWGSGKSTILNYVRTTLGSRLDGDHHFVIDFDPWWLEEGASIASSLLAAVLSALPQKDATAVSKAVGHLADAVSKMPEGTGDLLRLWKKTEALGDAVEAARHAGGDLAAILNASKPARRLRGDVAKAFNDGGFKFVVFIDDLDRLTPEQALQVMSAIRSIVDLPGFVYILAYDSSALANILRSSKPPLGHDYVEKIVNVSVPVPPITFAQMESFVGKLLAEPLWGKIKDANGSAHREALISLLDTPRDAIRFANAANFWTGSKTDEVFVPDFLLLEAIRLARPPVYAGLLKTADVWLDRSSRSPLDHVLGERGDKSAEIDRRKAKVDRELELGTSQRDDVIRRALTTLFPNHHAALGQSRSYSAPRPDGHSISVPDHFFTYFLHKPVVGAATRLEINELVAPETSFGRREELIGLITARSPGDVSPLRHLIACLDGRLERSELSRDVAVQLAQAFAGPHTVIAPFTGPFSDSDLTAVRGIITRLLMAVGTLTDVEVQVLSRREVPLSTLKFVHLDLTVGTEFYLLQQTAEQPIVKVDNDALRDFTERFVDRALAAIRDGSVFQTALPPWLFYMSKKARPAALVEVLREASSDPTRIIKLLEFYRGYSNPLGDVAEMYGISVKELQEQVEAALAVTGIDREGWWPWRFFRELQEPAASR